MSEVPFFDRFWSFDQARPDAAEGRTARLRVVSRAYFRTMRIPILQGRDFTIAEVLLRAQDGIGEIGKTRVIIVNEAMASLVWPGQNPLGQKAVGGERGNAPAEVIGVAGNVRYAALDTGPMPEVYYLSGLFPQDEFALVIRTASDPHAMAQAVRTAVLEIERDVFIGSFQTMDEVVSNSVAARKFTMLVLSVFSAAGLLLAVAGTAGIIAYSLSLRVREIGIRIATGAGPRHVMSLVCRQGLVPAWAGLGVGLLLAVGLMRFLSRLLSTVSEYDPVVYISAAASLALVSILTSVIAAYRACRVDPAAALK